MKLLQALTAYIAALPGVNRDSMEGFADLGTLIPTGIDHGHGFEIGKFKYDAVISIEDYPAEQGALLLPALIIWVAENDPDRERAGLSDMEVDITMTDQETVFVQISITFNESLFVIEDKQGPLSFMGKKWKVADVPIDVATKLNSIEKS
ncbi:MAG: phage tail protein [Desulfotalea sp.]